MITLIAPIGSAPLKSFVTKSGSLIRPVDGQVTVDDLDAPELLANGWRLDRHSEKAARFRETMLCKAADAAARRISGPSAPTRTEFGELETGGRFGRVVIAHDRGADTVSIHGIAFDLSGIDSDLRAGFRVASAAYVDAALDFEAQSDARALIGIVTNSILERHDDFIGGRVRDR